MSLTDGNMLRRISSNDLGSNFLACRLNPTDGRFQPAGIPDASMMNTVCFRNDFEFIIAAPANVGTSTTWNIDMVVNPHIIQPVSFVTTGGTLAAPAGVAELGCGLNTNYGPTHANIAGFLSDQFEAWRPVGVAVTMEPIANMTINQGSVLAAQYKCTCTKHNVDVTLDNAGTLYKHPLCHVREYESDDFPNRIQTARQFTKYSGEFAKGVFMPLAITTTKWETEEDFGFLGPRFNQTAPADLHPALPLANAAAISAFPFLTGAGSVNGVAGTVGIAPLQVTPAVAGDTVIGNETYFSKDRVMGRIFFEGLALTASVRCKVFVIWEGVPTTAGTYFALSKPSGLDPVAVNAARFIWPNMKGAYPAAYNDAGEIWDVISGAIKAVSPFLAMIPEIGPFLSMAAMGVSGAGDAIRRALTNTKDSQSRDSKATSGDLEIMKAIPASQMPINNLSSDGGHIGPRGW